MLHLCIVNYLAFSSFFVEVLNQTWPCTFCKLKKIYLLCVDAALSLHHKTDDKNHRDTEKMKKLMHQVH